MSLLSEPRLPDWRYRGLMLLLAPVLAGYTLWQGCKERNSRLVRQRLGLSVPQRTDRPLWLHMASVGEVNAARPLIAALRRDFPGVPMVVSTFTPTGAAAARRALPADIEHVFLPLDLGVTTARFLARVAPRCALVLETEIWPRLFYQCRRRDIPLVIVNGRLSSKTLDRPAWMRAIVGRALANVTAILARSADDAARFITLGAAAERVSELGNLKFAEDGRVGDAGPVALERRYVLAASTHADEELQLARAWRDAGAGYLLVIVPRHPGRAPAITARLRALGIDVAVRSKQDTVTQTTDVYLADTFGELAGFIAGAELVFVGGSLIPRGGQNLIEVARHGKVALFGPHMENFYDESRLLLEHNAAVQVETASQLLDKVTELLADPEERLAIGRRAAETIAARADIAQRYSAALAQYLV
ncbi:MAG: 3-deoxy-D-manno-octulosonic-acid transferase [Gammaproteobacteria bacterium]|nr:MAG: 3-deoxy-D-manno-octulosonic-acid transferase [Gammaproteobacteria bacterium]TND05837.1 MAG: 3-deoxy-D-manno-octulosonic-acid transferase [Gammaproteobacteria bacterium]